MKQKILFIVSLLFGLMFINAGLNKFFNYMPMPEDMPEQVMSAIEGMMQIGWLMPFLATFEIIGGVLVIMPRLRALGALILVPIMAGILVNHAVLDPSTLAMPLILAAILGWIIADNWNSYLPIVQKQPAEKE